MRPAAGGRWGLGAIVLVGGLLMVRETRGPGGHGPSRWTPLHHVARAATTSLRPEPRVGQTMIVTAREVIRPLG